MINQKIIEGEIIRAYLVGQKFPRSKRIADNRTHLADDNSFDLNFDAFWTKINQNNKYSRYFDRLKEALDTNHIRNIDQYENIKVDISWIKIEYDGITKLLNLVKPKMESIINYFEQYDQQYNLKQELSELKNISNQLQNSSFFTETNQYFHDRYIILNEVYSIIDESSKTLKNNYYYNTKPYINKDIGSNPLLANFKNKLEELKVTFPELQHHNEKSSVIDLMPLQKYITEFEDKTLTIFNKLRNEGLAFSQSDVFFDHYKNSKPSSIGDFIKKVENKEEEKNKFNIRDDVDISASLYDKIITFKDDSLLFRKNDGEYIIVNSVNQIKDLKQQLVKESIRNEFKKNPQIAKHFIEIAKKNDFEDMYSLNISMKTYKENIEILKLYKVDPLETFLKKADNVSSYKSLELLDDYLHKVVKDHKVKQYAHSISSNKYEHLYDERTYKIIEDIYDFKIQREDLQNYIGKKIAAYKTPEDFNEALKSFYNSFNEFNHQSIIKKANYHNARILIEDEDLVVLEIKSFGESKIFGSSSWCISRDASYFDSYTSEDNQQYIVFDFSKESDDIASMIGITLDSNGNYSAAHYKDDEGIDPDDLDLQNFINVINEVESNLILLESKKETVLKNKL